MKLSAQIKVMNNSTLPFDHVEVSTFCMSSLDITFPSWKGHAPFTVELNRRQLIEFLLRTQPALSMELRVDSNLNKPASE